MHAEDPAVRCANGTHQQSRTEALHLRRENGCALQTPCPPKGGVDSPSMTHNAEPRVCSQVKEAKHTNARPKPRRRQIHQAGKRTHAHRSEQLGVHPCSVPCAPLYASGRPVVRHPPEAEPVDSGRRPVPIGCDSGDAAAARPRCRANAGCVCLCPHVHRTRGCVIQQQQGGAAACTQLRGTMPVVTTTTTTSAAGGAIRTETVTVATPDSTPAQHPDFGMRVRAHVPPCCWCCCCHAHMLGRRVLVGRPAEQPRGWWRRHPRDHCSSSLFSPPLRPPSPPGTDATCTPCTCALLWHPSQRRLGRCPRGRPQQPAAARGRPSPLRPGSAPAHTHSHNPAHPPHPRAHLAAPSCEWRAVQILPASQQNKRTSRAGSNRLAVEGLPAWWHGLYAHRFRTRSGTLRLEAG